MRVLKNSIPHTFVTSDNVSVYYETDDISSRSPTLVFIHGIGGDLVAWDDLRAYFQHVGYRTLAVDLRGHGLSERPKKRTSYAIERFARDVVEIIAQEKLQSYVVIGHCFGGMVAQVLENIGSDTASGLILIDTSYTAPWFLGPLKSHASLHRVLRFLGKSPFNIGLFHHADSQKYIGTSDFDVRRFFSDLFHTSVRSYLLSLDTVISFNGVRYMKGITVPTLILEGENDSIYPPQTAHELARMIPHAELSFIPEANHILVLNNVDAVAKEILTFCQTLFHRTK